MSKRRTRQVYFACAALSEDSQLLSELIPAATVNEASDIFVEKFKVKPKSVLGPLYKKKTQVLDNTVSIMFTQKSKLAEYNGWVVNAQILKMPEHHAYLLFNRRIDGKNLPKPQGSVVVPIHDLRFINVE